MKPSPGQQLLHYRLIEKIGEGGMGIVWKAEDTKLHRKVALKILPPATASDADRLARFEREARAVAALKHPNIVTLYSVEQADATHFITMELVEGLPLTASIPKRGLPLERLLEIAVPLAEAVSHAHRVGITHRDLKPDNIMIDEDGRLRVLDFGLAKLAESPGASADTQMATVTSDTVEGRVLGTVAYMSPEQAEGKPVDARSDIFSIGIILYEMATGTRPFRGDTRMSTIGSILKEDPSSVTELKPSLPRDLSRIVRRCLAKDPDRRYQTALDLRNELDELKHGADSGEVATPATSPRKSGLKILAGVLALVAVSVLVTLQLAGNDNGPAAPMLLPRPIAVSTAWDNDPNWSPDGEFVAFGHMQDGNVDVYVQPREGGTAVARATGAGDQSTPRWSPDGRHLAYVSTEKEGSPVFLISPDGGDKKELIATNVPRLNAEFGDVMGDRPWSSDSRTLLVSRSDVDGRAGIYRVDRASGEAEMLVRSPEGVEDLRATYSFDGARILFRRVVDGRGSIMTLPVDGGEPELLYGGEDLSVVAVSWRPDGRHVVFTTANAFEDGPAGFNQKIMELDTLKGSVRRLYVDQRLWGVSVSSDDRVAFANFRHDTFLFQVDLESGERTQVTNHAQDNGWARYSPDGTTIAYTSNRTGRGEVWLYHLDGRPETRFTGEQPYETGRAEWSPDGRLAYVSSQDGGKPKIFVTSADGTGGARMLVDQTVNWRGPRWSPAGDAVSYTVGERSGSESLWTVAPDGENARLRVRNVREFDWYPGGERGLIIRELGSETELLAVDLETGREELLYAAPVREIDVAPDGSAVVFCTGQGHLSMGLVILKLAPPADPSGLPTAVGEPRLVVPSEGTWHTHSPTWSPDSKSLVYTRDWDYGNIYELVEDNRSGR